MAYQDQFYTVGTVTVTNGSTAVTGSGTGWETALIAGGVFYAGGGAYPIQSVASDTEMTLAIPYVGVDAAGVGYAIDRQRAAAISNIAMNDRLAQIIREISIGNIEDLNALDLLANMIIVTDGAGHFAQVAKTALPISAATQSALDQKVTAGNPQISSGLRFRIGSYPNQSRMFDFSWAGGFPIWGADIEGNGNLSWQQFNGANGAYVRTPVMFLGNGNTQFNGTISKAGGTFEIDHPLDPLNKNLRHGFVESTEYVNIYRGMVELVDGRMSVDIDAAFGMTKGTFAALNADVMVSSLQNQFGPDRVWVEGPADSGTFTIVCENDQSTATIAWMVTGRRNDPFVRSHLDPNTDSQGKLIPEFEKPDYVELANV